MPHDGSAPLEKETGKESPVLLATRLVALAHQYFKNLEAATKESIHALDSNHPWNRMAVHYHPHSTLAAFESVGSTATLMQIFRKAALQNNEAVSAGWPLQPLVSSCRFMTVGQADLPGITFAAAAARFDSASSGYTHQVYRLNTPHGEIEIRQIQAEPTNDTFVGVTRVLTEAPSPQGYIFLSGATNEVTVLHNEQLLIETERLLEQLLPTKKWGRQINPKNSMSSPWG